MRSPRRLLAALALPLPAALLSAACADDPDVAIGLVMSAPQGVLDEASSVALKVFPAEGKSCQSDGSASEVPSGAKQFALKSSGCEGGATWCGEISLPQDGSEQMFFVEARNAGGLLAQGCGTATIDQDPVEVSIKVVRYVQPACCGDGALQPGELCDTGPQGGACEGITADDVCEDDCSAKAIPVDREAADPPLGAVGQGHLSLAFAAGVGQLDGGLRAAFVDGGGTNADVGLRFFQRDLSAVTSPATLGRVHSVLLQCSGSDAPIPRQQKSPSIAATGSGAAVAFLSNKLLPTRHDVAITFMTDAGCSEAAEVTLSDQLTTVDDLDIATGPGGDVLVVWQQGGQILGTTWSPTGGAGSTVTIAPAGATPRVAGSSAGWVVVYRGAETGDDDGVFARRVGAALQVSNPVLVNAATSGVQDQPDVAVLADGRWAAVWRGGSDVFFQRFSLDDSPTSGDQDAPLSTTSDGEQAQPVVVGAAGEYFVAAWESGSELRSRMLGGSEGFLFNAITGQNDDFPITAGASQPRRPAIAVGEFIAYGWEDLAGAAAGLYVRRFPVPAE